MLFARSTIAALLVLIAGSSAVAEPGVVVDRVPSFTEEVVRVPLEDETQSMSQVVMLEATVFRPTRKGVFPLVVINHGATGGPDRNPRWRPTE